MKVHPSAIIDKKAKIDRSVEIGPYVVIDKNVVIDKGVTIGPGVYITGNTYIGEGCSFHKGVVIGDAPQDLNFRNGMTSYVKIGKNNIFREYSQVHRSKIEKGATIIGDNNYFMALSHVAHDCVIGNNIVVCNGALLAGHVIVEDGVFISGNCTIHQYIRLGKLCFLQGLTAVSKDVPPFMIAGGINSVIGLNLIGLRRAEYNIEDRKQIKEAYNILYRKGYTTTKALEELETNTNKYINYILNFIKKSQRGICSAYNKDFIREVKEASLVSQV